MTLESSPIYSIQDSNRLEETNVHQVYNQIASHFSETRYKPWPKVSTFLNSQPSGSFGCDVGCGNGKYLGVNPNLFILGVDRCPNLISICQKNGFEALIADGLSLPFNKASFDFVLSIAVIHHFSTPERRIEAIKELLRILKPKGQALVYVWAWQQSGRRYFPTQDVFVPWQLKSSSTSSSSSSSSSSLSSDISDSEASPVYQRYYHVFREGELEELVIQAGGQVVESGFEKDNYYCCLTPLL